MYTFPSKIIFAQSVLNPLHFIILHSLLSLLSSCHTASVTWLCQSSPVPGSFQPQDICTCRSFGLHMAGHGMASSFWIARGSFYHTFSDPPFCTALFLPVYSISSFYFIHSSPIWLETCVYLCAYCLFPTTRLYTPGACGQKPELISSLSHG